MQESSNALASILCVGMGWFPKTPGGLNRYVYELISQLAINGNPIELCATGIEGIAPHPLIHLTNLADPGSPLPQRLWLSRKTFQQRQMKRPDAINLHFALYGLPLLKDLPAGIPRTFTFHGPWASEGQIEGQSKSGVWFKQWVEQQVYRQCDRFIVLSKAFGTILHQAYNVPWEQIEIIPGGVNTQRFQPNLSRQSAREQLGWDNDRFILFSPRRLMHRMGLTQLIEAIAAIRSQAPEIWLAIAGKGPIREMLEQQINDLGLSHQVKLLGYLPDEQLPIAYQAADLTVVPSQGLEGFGLILLESLASGTPVLCTPIGGMPEVIANFSPHLIAQSAQVSAIADCLLNAFQHRTSLPSREACRDYACTHYDWQTIAPQVQSVLLR